MTSNFWATKACAGSGCNSMVEHALRTPDQTRRATLASGLLTALGVMLGPVTAAAADAIRFKRVPTQFIAALGNTGARSGNGAQRWGLWPLDPGPRGVMLADFERLKAAGGRAPEGWKFDAKDWWLEEHGLIMEPPEFPLAPRKYRVTGDREVSAVLTIHPADKSGDMRWELDQGASLHDVTHLGCRAARYSPAPGQTACSPTNAQQSRFPVTPGAVMPPVMGCQQLEYSVLIVRAVSVEG